MDFATMGHEGEECDDLPVSLLMVLHAFRGECEKSVELTACFHLSCLLFKP